jgi:hypothetical protein
MLGKFCHQVARIMKLWIGTSFALIACFVPAGNKYHARFATLSFKSETHRHCGRNAAISSPEPRHCQPAKAGMASYFLLENPSGTA